MVEITLKGEVAQRLKEVASRQNMTPEAWVQEKLGEDQSPISDEEYERRLEEALRELRPGFYARARRYWEEVGDKERLALTDAELDEQFWLFDQYGIPRLKSEQGTIKVPPNPLVRMAENARRLNLQGRSDLSENADEIVEQIIW
jgi:hypothetical protein